MRRFILVHMYTHSVRPNLTLNKNQGRRSKGGEGELCIYNCFSSVFASWGLNSTPAKGLTARNQRPTLRSPVHVYSQGSFGLSIYAQGNAANPVGVES